MATNSASIVLAITGGWFARCHAKNRWLAGQGQTIDLRDDILESTRQLTAAYGLNGVFNVQFREGQNGLGLLEINPRMSGGIAMACLAGPNLPYLALRGFDRGFDGSADSGDSLRPPRSRIAQATSAVSCNPAVSRPACRQRLRI